MAYASLSLVVTGTAIASAWGNQVRANFAVSAPGVVTTAGDLTYATGANALARLAVGSTGQVLQVVGGAPAWGDAPGGWLIHLDARLGGDAHVNWNTPQAFGSGAYPIAGYLYSSGAQNAEVTFNNVALSAGTWKVLLGLLGDNSSGIVSVQFDGVEKGTVDTYTTAAPFGFVLGSVTGIAVAASARIALKLKMATKNGSSAGYAGRVAAVELRRTA